MTFNLNNLVGTGHKCHHVRKPPSCGFFFLSNHQAPWIPPESPWWSLRGIGNGASVLYRRVKGQLC